MLSQAEIDALLNGSIELDEKDSSDKINLADLMNPSGNQPRSDAGRSKNIQTYNFWSPDRFSKEQMRAVELVHEDLAERLTTSLPTFLRTNVRPRLVHTEQGRFHDFVKDFPGNSLFHMITLAPLPSQMIFTLSPNVSLIVLEQRLGGKIEGNLSERPLTDIDQALLRELVEHMLGDIKAAWGKLVTIEPMLEDSTTNQHWVQMMMGNERVMLLTFEILISGVSGTMSLFIPFTTLKPIASLLNPHIWITGKKEQQIDPAVRSTVMENLNQVVLPFTVVLGNARLKISEIVSLQVGDVIPLESGPADPLTILVAHKRQFIGTVGKSNRHYAVQIIDAIHEKDVLSDKGSVSAGAVK